MDWTTVEIRVPTEFLQQLADQQQRVNEAEAIPISRNEFLVELLRAGLEVAQARHQGHAALPGPAGGAVGDDTGGEGGGTLDGTAGAAERPDLTLHAAMAQVLREIGQPMRFSAIRAEVIRRGLYREKAGTPPSHQQVRARVANYPQLFRVDRSKDPHEVALVEWG